MRFKVAIQGGSSLFLAIGVAAQAQVASPGQVAQPQPGIQAPPVQAQAPDVDPDTPIRALPGDFTGWFPGPSFFPGNSFTRTHMAQFAANDIETVGDLIRADTALVGRILETDPRSAQRFQAALREVAAGGR